MNKLLERLNAVAAPGYRADKSCLGTAARYIDHVFDVLGSGPVKLFYGMTPQGPDGYTYSYPDDNYEDTFRSALEAAPERAAYLKAARELRDEYVPGFSPIPWHTDLKTGYVYETVWHTRVPVAKIPGVDAKTPSDLARGHNLLSLAQAYQVSGDRKYKREAIAELLDWISVTPPFYTPGWRNGMNVSVRAANIITAMALLKLDEADPLDARFIPILTQCLKDHRHHVSLTIEIYRSHNHITAELCGLTLLCAVLGEEESADMEEMESFAWGRYAWMQLNKEVAAQIMDDGFDFENSASYHAYVLEMVLYPTLHAARIHGCRTAKECREFFVAKERFSADNLERIRKGGLALKALTQPDGTIPFVGDNDAGRYVMWEAETLPTDRRSLSCVMAVFFDDMSLLPASVRPEDFLAARAFFDDAKVPAADVLAKACDNSVARAEFFPKGGYTVFEKDGFKALMHMSAGGHCNNDQLAVTLSVGGKYMVVDPGTYSYTGCMEWRLKLRSLRVHSTVMVDDEETDRKAGEWAFGGDPSDVPFTHIPVTEQNGVFAGGATHKAWMRLPDRITVTRIVSWNKEDRYTVTDTIEREEKAPAEGVITERFALHPACEVKLLSEREAEIVREGVRVRVATEGGRFVIEDAVFSPTYGVKEDSKNLTVLLPRDAAENRVEFTY